MIASILIAFLVIYLLAYLTYGRFLARAVGLDDARVTPAVAMNDGVDFVPAKSSLLLGQHFSAIAAAGPIVGPILAALWFGWAPALLWVLFGAVFIGGVHDFGSLAASIRHKATSVAELVRNHMSRTSHLMFLIFMWLSVDYLIITFADVTAQTFRTMSATEAFGPGVAVSSFLYILAAMVLGVILHRGRVKLWMATLLFVPVILFIIWVGPRMPESVLTVLAGITTKQWDVALLAYCFMASVIPMWLLLQPRGYLGGWLLYATIGVGFLGALFGGIPVQYPAFNLDQGWASLLNGKMVLPILFITVACGACSGFHALVSSGTTSKQIAREKDVRLVGYGGMLMEGIVAVLAVATVMILAPGSALLKSEPNLIYASGIAGYLRVIGVKFSIAYPFALLAFSTFVYDTLDVATRLGRYILQEIFGITSRKGALLATLGTLILPLAFLLSTKEKGYLVAWPIFGTSNQLLASLTLLAVAVWLKKSGKKYFYTLIPMVFMALMTVWSLIIQIRDFLKVIPSWKAGQALKPDVMISGIVGIALFVMTFFLVAEAVRVLRRNELIKG